MDEFKKWIANKRFTSIGNEHPKIDSRGTYEQPIGNLVLQFHGDKLSVGNCVIDYDCIDDDGRYKVSYKECGEDGEYFELVIPSEGNPFVVSRAYDTSSLNRPAGDASMSGIRQLDIIATRQEVKGNEMEVSEH